MVWLYAQTLVFRPGTREHDALPVRRAVRILGASTRARTRRRQATRGRRRPQATLDGARQSVVVADRQRPHVVGVVAASARSVRWRRRLGGGDCGRERRRRWRCWGRFAARTTPSVG